MTTSPHLSLSIPPHPTIKMIDETMRTADHSMGVPRSRSRCISCSDNTYAPVIEDTSLLLDFRPRKYRTPSICEQIQDNFYTGTVMYFCRSRGHGFIRPDSKSASRRASMQEANVCHSNNNTSHLQEPERDHFVHISDIECDYVPLKGDQVSYRLCPIPPKFEKLQAVNVNITNMSPVPHNRWDSPQTPEENEEPMENDNLPPPGDI